MLEMEEKCDHLRVDERFRGFGNCLFQVVVKKGLGEEAL